MVERGRQQMMTWRMRIACWIMKATNTHSEYGIRYTDIACLVEHLLHGAYYKDNSRGASLIRDCACVEAFCMASRQ